MLIAIAATLLDKQIISFTEILVTVLVGSVIGTIAARRVAMTAMPELVAVFNGFGGGASVLVAASAYWSLAHDAALSMGPVIGTTVVISVIIGSVTLTGSLVAFGKLKGLISGRAIMFSGQHLLNASLFVLALVFATLVVTNPNAELWMLLVIGIALLLGCSP